MTAVQRRLGWLGLSGALVCALVVGAIGLGAQAPVGVNPGLVRRHLLPAADRLQPRRPRDGRGRRGVDTRLYYMGSAGGVFKTTDAGVDVDAGHRRPDQRRIDWRDRGRRVGSRTSSTSARARPIRAATSRTATACTSPRTPARPGSTSASRRPASSAASASIRTNPNIVFVAAVGNCFGPNKERGIYRIERRRRDVGAGATQIDREHRRQRSDDGSEESRTR